MENTELAISQQNLYISPIVGMEEAKAKFEQVREFTAKCLTKGTDYGSFAGVSKPSLLKPGAEKISTLFGLTPKFTCVDKIMNWNGDGNPDNEPFFYFEYKCELFKNAEYVASCIGSCNSWEKKYRYRHGELVCPNCGKPLRKSKNGDSYYCWAKQGGCGATFPSNDPRVSNQKVGDVKNMDTAEQVNTFQKMAQKRAFIGAVLIACNLSEYYTQDIEDMASFAVTNEIPPMDADFQPVDEPVQKPQQQPQTQQQKPLWNEAEFLKQWSKPAGVGGMSRVNAESMVDDKGSPYGEKSTQTLWNMQRVIMKKMNAPEITQDQKDLYSMKLSAICEILQCRKVESMPQVNDAQTFVQGA